MANDIDQKRQAVMGAYPSRRWRDKVRDMTEDQVVAIFLRLKGQNKLKL